MAKKQNANVAQETKDAETEKKKIGYETFDLLSDTVFNPIELEEQQEAADELELAQNREYMREAGWVDIVRGIFNMPPPPPKNDFEIKKKFIPYNKLSKFALKNGFYMTLQGFSHMFPQHAQYAFNHIGVNEVDVVNYINLYINTKFPYKNKERTSVYYSFFPKVGKAKNEIQYINQEGKKKTKQITNDDIIDFCKKMRWSLNDYNMACEIYGTDDIETSMCLYFDAEEAMKKDQRTSVTTTNAKKSSYDDDFDYSDNDRLPRTTYVSINQPTIVDSSVTAQKEQTIQQPQKITKEEPVVQPTDNNQSPTFSDNALFDAPTQEPVTQTESSVQQAISQQATADTHKIPEIKMTPVIHNAASAPVEIVVEKPKEPEVVIDWNCPLMFKPTEIPILDLIVS